MDEKTLLTIKYAIGVVIAMLLWILLSKWMEKTAMRYPPTFVRNIQDLVRQAAQLDTQSKQDDNIILSLIHINTALSYSYIARKFLSSKEIERITHINIDWLISNLEDDQLNIMKKIHSKYPELQPEGVFVSHTGWIG